MDKIRLTQFSTSSGCGCKIAPAVLHGILENQFQTNNANVLVGIDSFDDATVIAINETDCIVSTTDFFTPLVNDAFEFGCIAAANAISDVYAMGGKPISAISVLGFPVDKIQPEIIKEIMAGGQSKCKEAGITISGGHSITAPEPFFGLCVTGIIKKENIKRNNTAQAGDKIYLTKPLGTGVFSAALKRDILEESHYKIFFNNASKLNSIGEILGTKPFVHAMTDVTGFGLLGHLVEMSEGSTLSAEITAAKVPLLPNLQAYIEKSCIPASVYRNWNACEKKIHGLLPESFVPFNDPQTNGGLLIAVDPAFEEEFVTTLHNNGMLQVYEIGVMKEQNEFSVYFV